MVAAARTPRRDRIAIAGSIAIHLCVLAVWATAPRPSFPVDEPDERRLFATIIRLEHRPPAPRAAVRPVTAPIALRTAAPLPVIHAAVTTEHAARKLVVQAERRAGTVPVPVPEPRRRRVSEVATIRAVPLASPKPVAVVATTAAPVAAPAASPAVAEREEGIGNFGETYPASIDPASRGSLLSGVAGVVVRVTVDENGRATSIDFVRAPADLALRDELRTRLLAAHFIPAACNGLRCAGTLELRS